MKRIKLSDTDFYINEKDQSIIIPIDANTSLVVSALEVMTLSTTVVKNLLTEQKVPAKVSTAMEKAFQTRRRKSTPTPKAAKKTAPPTKKAF